jgi:hypothetical protein
MIRVRQTQESFNNMKNRFLLASVLSAFALTVAASAQTTGSGTLGVTANVTGSINLTFITDASGMAVTGTGTGTASLPFGPVKMYGGAAIAGVTETVTPGAGFKLATPFDIEVDLANTTSGGFSLVATLTTADATNAWSINATDISSGAAVTIPGTGLYGAPTSYAFALVIPASEPIGLITNTINFTATAN